MKVKYYYLIINVDDASTFHNNFMNVKNNFGNQIEGNPNHQHKTNFELPDN